MKEILRVQHRKLASPPFSFTEKHSRPEEPKVILELIGKYQSECTLPHQSETPFVGERSFSNEQSVRAGGFFFPLPLPLPQFFFLSPTLGKFFTSPQLSTVSRWRPEQPMEIYIHSPHQNPPALQASAVEASWTHNLLIFLFLTLLLVPRAH